MSVMIATRDVPGNWQTRIRAGRTRIDHIHPQVSEYPDAWRPERSTGPPSPAEMAVRDRAIRAIDAADRRTNDDGDRRFWDSTSRFLDRLEDPGGRKARAHREHMANVEAYERAEAAQIQATADDVGGWVAEALERRRRWS